MVAGGTAFALFPIVLGAVPAMILLAGALAIGVILSAIAW